MISGYINSVPFSVYNCGEFVLEDIDYYYIQWWPSNIISGTFKLGHSTYNVSDYSSGFFSGFDGSIGYQAWSAPYITSIDTNAYYIGLYAFDEILSLNAVTASRCTFIDVDAFHSCYNLSSIRFPRCSFIESDAFADCRSLQSVYLPVCTYIEIGAFLNCYSLSSITLPMCSEIRRQAFAGCSILSYIDLPVCSYIGSYAFDAGTTSSVPSVTVYLRSNSVCSLQTSSAFVCTRSSHISKYCFFVPSSLVDSYKTKQYWSYFSSRIFPIPE